MPDIFDNNVLRKKGAPAPRAPQFPTPLLTSVVGVNPHNDFLTCHAKSFCDNMHDNLLTKPVKVIIIMLQIEY